MRMPTCLVLALLTMQPRLQAEESIHAANRVAMGSGTLTKQDAEAMGRAWAQQANPDAPKPATDPAQLAAIGFAVRRVKTKKKAPQKKT